jgi:hypothetical protein
MFYCCPNNFLICFGDGLNGIEPNWQFTGPSLILGSTQIIITELFKFFLNQFPNTTLGKTDVVRPRNRFGKPNPGVSTPQNVSEFQQLSSGLPKLIISKYSVCVTVHFCKIR